MRRIVIRIFFTWFLFFCLLLNTGYAQVGSTNQKNSQSALTCDNWLHLPSQLSFVNIGDLDVAGNKITVEAVFNRTTPYTGGLLWAGDLVSKHDTPSDVNYLLRPNDAEITTTNGYFRTPDICEIELNKTYHVAMVYDGITLKFYRNGFLMSSVPATGNLFLNNWQTQIGLYQPAAFNTNMIGYINEVRIWNVARTQAEIETYMNSSLPNPPTQTGLLAYYTFDNLINKQGNTSWNGTLVGSASINQTNPECSFVADSCEIPPPVNVIASFNTPDTVCVNTPVNITNTSQNASSYYWGFCQADINQPPTGTNLGNVGGQLAVPVFIDYVFDNGNYYGFVINHLSGQLIRLDFGNSLLNAPTANNLGNFGGIIPNFSEGIQVVKNEGKWYAIIVGGRTPDNVPRILKVDFGANITNPTPIATNWGNIGNMDQPVDLHVFEENGHWYGFTVNAENNTITRFDFTTSFNNIPTGVNLGNLGGLNYPTGIFAINNNNNWYVFIISDVGNSLVRLDFGNSLLNTPTATNLGNLGNVLNRPRDIYIMKDCDQIIGFVVNGQGVSQLVKLNFNNNLSSVPTGVNLGNIGGMNFPHSISKLFRVGNDLYSFVTNAANNTITRLRFQGCTNSSAPISTAQNPPPITYSTAGTYSINLTVDEGLPTQTSFCRQVVVLPGLVHSPLKNISICEGDSIKIGSPPSLGTYSWNTGAITDSIYVHLDGIYWIETSNYGCVNRDSFSVVSKPKPLINLGVDTTLCFSDTLQLNAGNAGASYLWNTGESTQFISVHNEGDYYVAVTQNSCSNTDTIYVGVYDPLNFDFNYDLDVCNPLTVQFNGLGSTTANPYWDFGDNTATVGNQSATHIYTSAGNYVVKYSVGNGACTDTLTKTITVGVMNDNSLVSTTDTTICFGTNKQLRTNSSLSFCWSPTTYLDNPASSQPVTSATENITYYFTAETTGNNLIVNGNFSQGNTGFTSQYTYTPPPNTLESQYFVGTNPQAWQGGYLACNDHSTGNGNMMIVNGSPVNNAVVWSQTIAIQPNKIYAFSAWILKTAQSAPPEVQFSINGFNLGSNFQASSSNCLWRQFYTTWNSGSSTSAVISVLNRNVPASGNDFALDDISFTPLYIKRDSVKIMVDSPFVKTNIDTVVCAKSLVQLNTTGAQTYSWTPSDNLSDVNIANPVASPVTPTQYIVTGTNANGCIAKDSVMINIFTASAIDITEDTTICRNTSVQLLVSGGTSYNWSPSVTLNDPLAPNPIASPVGNTIYYVAIKDNNNCDYLDSVTVSLSPVPVFAVNDPVKVCLNDSIQLNASGGDIYNWQPAIGLNNAAISNPKASPQVDKDYFVTITETTCNESATLSTRVIISPLPDIKAFSSNDIDCSNDRSQLNATGGNRYVWAPSSTLNNSNIGNPVARPVTTTKYVVKGFDDVSSCINYDSVMVKVDSANKGGYLMPNAFTPNGDGLNDCFGIRFWGIIQDLEFSIYNRWGVRVFYTSGYLINAGMEDTGAWSKMLMYSYI